MKGEIKQFCVLTEDAEAMAKEYWEKLGIGPWAIRHFTPETMKGFTVDGKLVEEDFDFICAVCWEGNMEYELIQPIKGPNSYWRYLEKYGPGLHHFKIVIPDDEELAAYVKSFEAKGIKVMQTGWFDNDVHYNLDTMDELGVVVELGNGGKIRDAKNVYPTDASERPVKHHQNIRQLAMVVDDVEKYMNNYARLLGINDWDVRHFTPSRMKSLKIEGKDVEEDYDFICAVTWAGDMELELVQPIKGPAIYWDFLNSHGPGFHHIKDVWPDEELIAEQERLSQYGVRVLQNGWIDGDSHYYLNTEKIMGFILEQGNAGKIAPAEEVFHSTECE